MSYILDALRRADAERERDPARGIHAQPAVAVPARMAPRVPRWTWMVAGAAVAVIAGTIAWPEAAMAPAPAAAAPVPPVQDAPMVPIAPAPAALTVATAVSPPAPPPLPAPERAAPGHAPMQRVAAAERETSKRVPTTAAAAATAPASPAAAAPTPDRILAVTELPPDVQRELPKLAISGGVHSDSAAQRLLIVGGQVMNEGAELAPGVILEQIRARSAVLRFRGFRYSVQY